MAKTKPKCGHFVARVGHFVQVTKPVRSISLISHEVLSGTPIADGGLATQAPLRGSVQKKSRLTHFGPWAWDMVLGISA